VPPLPAEQLYTLAADRPDVSGSVMLEMLDGFVDAGAARRLARDQLLDGTSIVVATFDVDLLFDYRARRPAMLFVEDHWQSYDAPALELRLLTDKAGTSYLLLTGPEPDVLWERFATAVEQLVTTLGVRLTIGTNAIPMAVPHTRPVGVTAHASRPELIEGHTPWVGTVQVPGSASALVEHRLGEAGHDAMGFAVHVPHYLAQAAFPPAAEELLRAVGAAAGLALPTGQLEVASREARDTISTLVAQSDELAELVGNLEGSYDAFLASRATSLTGSGPLPSADELAAELERFLAEQPRKREDPS
jgi:hypothetical protein